jgi:hypothetical protein
VTEREKSLWQVFLLVSITVGLAFLHGTFFWIFTSVAAVLWLRFLELAARPDKTALAGPGECGIPARV